MEIAIEIEFEQRGGIIRRAADVGATGFGKAERVQIERSDEGIQETHGIGGGDIIVERFREEQRLGAIQASTMIHA